MKQFLKALDAGFTAFCNELWLPTFGFHLFDDPADALEDDVRPCHMCDETCGVCRDAVLDERAKRVVDVPVELAGSRGAPGDGPEVGDSPRSAPTSGQPRPLTQPEWACAIYAARYMARGNDGFSDKWGELAQLLLDHMDFARTALK